MGKGRWENGEKIQGQNVIPFFQRFELRTPRIFLRKAFDFSIQLIIIFSPPLLSLAIARNFA